MQTVCSWFGGAVLPSRAEAEMGFVSPSWEFSRQETKQLLGCKRGCACGFIGDSSRASAVIRFGAI